MPNPPPNCRSARRCWSAAQCRMMPQCSDQNHNPTAGQSCLHRVDQRLFVASLLQCQQPSATAAEMISAMLLSPTKLRKPPCQPAARQLFLRMVFPAINTIGSSTGNNDRPSDGSVLSSRLAISSSLAMRESAESRNGTCHLLSPFIHFA